MAIQVFRAPDVVLDESPGHHDYSYRGIPMPGLTSILERGGCYDLSFVAERVLEPAARFGGEVHQYCHWADDSDLDLKDLTEFPEHECCVRGWMDFRNDHDFAPYLVEEAMAIEWDGMRFGMKPDRIGIIGVTSKPYVVEIKTTARIEPHFALQTAGQALSQKAIHPLPGRMVVQLLKTPLASGQRYRLREYTDRNDEQVFRAALALDIWKNNHNVA